MSILPVADIESLEYFYNFDFVIDSDHSNF